MQAIRILAAAAVMFVASTAWAQVGQGAGRMGGEEMQRRQNEMLFKDITLTDAQKAKIDSIQVAARAATQALMQSGGDMRDSTARAKRMELRTRERADIRAVLTTEQQLTFDRNVAAMPQRGGRRPPTRR